MTYLQDIYTAHSAPERLEQLYRAARRAGEVDAFTLGIVKCHDAFPDHLLYAAWYYRLQKNADERGERRQVNWKLAIPFSTLSSVLLWALSFGGDALSLLGAPIAALCAVGFLTLSAKARYYARALLISLALAALGAAALLAGTRMDAPDWRRYVDLASPHIALLAWAGVGIAVLGPRSAWRERFAFLSKSFELFVTAGIYAVAGLVFVGVTFGLFDALNVAIPLTLGHLLIVGGIGLIPVLVIASAYDLALSPAQQEFGRGVGWLTATVLRLLLPLTLIVLVVYLCAIPFNFMEPFRNRRMLVASDVLLFAIMALLLGVTPFRRAELAPPYQAALRAGIIAVAALTVVISLYALAAVVYRTTLRGITVNRLAIIGWNSINIGILALLIYRQLRAGSQVWLEALQSTFSLGAAAYTLWALIVVLASAVFLLAR